MLHLLSSATFFFFITQLECVWGCEVLGFCILLLSAAFTLTSAITNISTGSLRGETEHPEEELFWLRARRSKCFPVEIYLFSWILPHPATDVKLIAFLKGMKKEQKSQKLDYIFTQDSSNRLRAKWRMCFPFVSPPSFCDRGEITHVPG